ncbi:MAG TPA: hypothetical protein DCG48_11390 [Rhodospirillaceae bacterium]|nr:hypothetical protein [Rhodospirillaceae bacterium]
MASRQDLPGWVLSAIKANKGQASILAVAKHIWKHHQAELEGSIPLFYTWQYDMRWAALTLRKRGLLKPADQSRRGVWELPD